MIAVVDNVGGKEAASVHHQKRKVQNRTPRITSIKGKCRRSNNAASMC
nr:MAG TPA: hypothetical protein [Bacteriophage sp.]